MFSPSQLDVRRFFAETRRKRDERLPLTPLETIAADWIEAHPEYRADLADAEAAAHTSYPAEGGRENPFLHLSMHLSISEQVSIDQPAGIRAAVEALAARLGSAHAAHHEAMECLGRMLWESQRSGRPPDGESYVECVRRRAR
jgi:bisphosphoglycerate-independent phosphoglycerate mutase (AlkP superfamily)